LRERQDRRGLREYLISSLCVTAGLAQRTSRYDAGHARRCVGLFGAISFYLSATISSRKAIICILNY